jgi:hypothetical protein
LNQKEGQSVPLETLAPIIAKDPFSVADKPGTPEAVDWSANHVDLKWEAPISGMDKLHLNIV